MVCFFTYHNVLLFIGCLSTAIWRIFLATSEVTGIVILGLTPSGVAPKREVALVQAVPALVGTSQAGIRLQARCV
jgi:hypothetical protein